MNFNIDEYHIESLAEINNLSSYARSELVKKYSWAIPTKEVIENLVPYCENGIVEICAGNGYWARCFASVGINVKAFDNEPWDNSWHFVEVGTEERAGDYPERVLFLCWPPYDEKVAVKSLHNHRVNGGEIFIYVGEDGGGCTGDESFHKYIHRYYKEIIYFQIPQWFGIHDYVSVYEVKK